jgi:hypothetical protein
MARHYSCLYECLAEVDGPKTKLNILTEKMKPSAHLDVCLGQYYMIL